MNLADLVKTTRYPEYGLGIVVKKIVNKNIGPNKNISKTWYKVLWTNGVWMLHEEEDIIIIKKAINNVKKR